MTMVQLEFARRNREIPSCDEAEGGGGGGGGGQGTISNNRTGQGGAGTSLEDVSRGTFNSSNSDVLGFMQEDLSDGSAGCTSLVPLARAVVAIGMLVGMFW